MALYPSWISADTRFRPGVIVDLPVVCRMTLIGYPYYNYEDLPLAALYDWN